MYLLRNNTIKTVTASFLAALLLCINTLKAVHEHHLVFEKETKKIVVDVTSVTAYFHCDICNFQIAKDSDTKTATCQVSSTGYYITSFADLLIKVPDHTSISFHVRGRLTTSTLLNILFSIKDCEH